jgi:hypothetical protein
MLLIGSRVKSDDSGLLVVRIEEFFGVVSTDRVGLL